MSTRSSLPRHALDPLDLIGNQLLYDLPPGYGLTRRAASTAPVDSNRTRARPVATNTAPLTIATQLTPSAAPTAPNATPLNLPELQPLAIAEAPATASVFASVELIRTAPLEPAALLATPEVLSAPAAIAIAAATPSTFVVVGLPDTQKYADKYPATFHAQTQWVVDNATVKNIRFVSHYGDIVEHGTNGDAPGEYALSVAAMDRLRAAGIPHGIAPGNHDVLPFGVHLPGVWDYDNSNYLQSFNPNTWHAGNELANGGYYGGASPSGSSSYQIFSGGGQDFLALHLDLETPHSELAWAQGVIDANRHLPVMVTTHRYLQDAPEYSPGTITDPNPVYFTTRMFDSGRLPNIWYSITGEILYNPNGIYAEDFYQHFVASNRNIFLVNAGHDAQEYHQTSINAYGLPVHEVLADFTYLENGGNGFLRLMEFDVAGNRINVSSYSPTLNQYKTDSQSQFSLNVDFDQYVAQNPTLRFQNGVSGYSGTQDTWINEGSKNSSYGNSSVIVVDDDTRNHWWYDYQGQGLVRFDGIVGNGAHQIPLGATIERANLKFALKDDTDINDAEFRVYAMTRSWNESSTWNSLGNGLSQGSDYGLYLGSFQGDDNPNDVNARWLDVRAAVQQWAGGATNYGFAIIPERLNWNDDGIEIYSSEASEIMFRPMLEVEYSFGSQMAAASLPLANLNASTDVFDTVAVDVANA